MQYDRVHMIWSYFDGVRTGIADLDGAPHYFACQFDEVADDYSENFKLYPVDSEFMRQATREWDLFLIWARKFHRGEVDLATHPAHGGIDPEYDDLKSWLKEQTTKLEALPSLYAARFHPQPGEETLPRFREFKVNWIETSRAA